MRMHRGSGRLSSLQGAVIVVGECELGVTCDTKFTLPNIFIYIIYIYYIILSFQWVSLVTPTGMMKF